MNFNDHESTMFKKRFYAHMHHLMQKRTRYMFYTIAEDAEKFVNSYNNSRGIKKNTKLDQIVVQYLESYEYFLEHDQQLFDTILRSCCNL
jgi:hypothetical protein